MDFSRRTAQLLHEDHVSTIALVEALEDMIARARKAAPDVTDPAIRTTLTKSAEMIERELKVHFAFEENELFTRLEYAGDVGIGEHLREEHAILLPLGETVAGLAANALTEGFTDETWASFRDSAGELIERMLAHIQKEEMALLPMLDDLLDPDADLALAQALSDAHS